MKNEEDRLKARFFDLDRMADLKNQICYSDFLNVNETRILHTIKQELLCSVQQFGGNESCERQMAAFVPGALNCTPDFPIHCIEIMAKNSKFADELHHRDVLGSIMNLGFERKLIGDIIVAKSKAFVFCNKKITDYVTENLIKIKHTTVILKQVPYEQAMGSIEYQSCSQTITSPRIDCIVAAVAGVSRSQAAKLILGEKVAVNSVICLHNTMLCKQGDRLSIRGYGKFILEDDSQLSKKGKLKLQYKKLI
ncbi:MAG: YlmH/Sll1252 family protein [Lachnospiraceae bacterium]